MNARQLTLPGMGEAFELPLLSKPKYVDGKKLTKKARWYLKIALATGVPRQAIIQEFTKYLKISDNVSYSHTYIQSMADIIITLDSGKTIRTFYNIMQLRLYVNVGIEDDLGKLYEIIEQFEGLTYAP